MKIELDETLSGKYRIDAYSSDGLVVNKTLYASSLIVTPDELITDWQPQFLPDLTVRHIHNLVDTEPEVLLLGTGARLQFPPNEILEPLMSGGIGFEVMDTGAACRAYNFMMGEGRRVVAALLRIESD